MRNSLFGDYLEVLSFAYVGNCDGGNIGIQNGCHFRLISAFLNRGGLLLYRFRHFSVVRGGGAGWCHDVRDVRTDY